jgi:hypothetical protein
MGDKKFHSSIHRGKIMIIVFGVCESDIAATKQLARWIAKLGGVAGFDSLIVADALTPFDSTIELSAILGSCFRSCAIISNGISVKGWPDGPNSLFRTAADHIERNIKKPWLWMEADAIPLSPRWAEAIWRVYCEAEKPFMGCVYDVDPAQQNRLPAKCMSGVAVYPADANSRLPATHNSPRPWDVDFAGLIVPNAVHTVLIQHFWGQPKLPPTFVKQRIAGSPRNAMTLDHLHQGAVLFHRNKDGTLMELLSQKLFGETMREKTKEMPGFVQMGRAGDLIHMLGAWKQLANGAPIKVITSREYAQVLDGASYVQAIPLSENWWMGMPSAIRYAQSLFGDNFIVTQCFGHQWGIGALDQWQNYTHSMWDRAGTWPYYKTAMPVFDKRSLQREAQLAKMYMRGKLPTLLVNFKGISSPFHEAENLMREIRKVCGAKVDVLDLAGVRAERIYDLLGLFDRAVGLITSDTATLHLAAAADIPYVAFTVDGWTSSVPKGNCLLEMKYSDPQKLGKLLSVMQRFL